MRATLTVLPFLLAACDQQAISPPEPRFAHDPASGETRARIAPGEGPAAELRSGPALPVVLPAGLTIYPGAAVLSNTRVTRSGQRFTLVEFETPDPVAKVVLFHRAQAESAGISLTLDLDGIDAASIGGTSVRGGDFALTARRESGRTIVQLSVSEPTGFGIR